MWKAKLISIENDVVLVNYYKGDQVIQRDYSVADFADKQALLDFVETETAKLNEKEAHITSFKESIENLISKDIA